MDATAATAEFLRRQSPPLEGTVSASDAIARVKYSHDAMIDLILTNPMISQGQIAKTFGYTQAWVSRIMNSDAFQARLAQRKADIVDPSICLTIDERLKAVAAQSLDVVLEKLNGPVVDAGYALEAAQLATKALGYGARNSGAIVQQNFVVALPTKVEDVTSWAAARNGGDVEVIEQQR